MKLSPASKAFAATALAAVLAGCNSGGGKSTETGSGGAVLQSMEYGRLVDVYAYRRIDETRDDRRDTANRQPVLIAQNVLVRPNIETDPLFDVVGNVRPDAQYRFLPFDVDVGHEELLILWDDRIPPEKAFFDSALSLAQTGLPTIPGSYRTQNTAQRPIPVVPRNAAIRLKFDQDLGVNSAWFSANENAIQLLEFITPENGGNQQHFRPVPTRIIAEGQSVILDTSLIGGEAEGGRNTDGMPPSLDSSTANIRIALPTVGVVSKVLEFAEDPVAELNGVDSHNDRAVIRDFRSGNIKDGEVGALVDVERPIVVANLKMGILAIDRAQRVLTINKRNYDVALRGRIPYVDGALDPNTGLALGPVVLPTEVPLRAGDVVTQTVQSVNGEPVRIRAEIVMNLDVGNVLGDPDFAGLGMYRTGSSTAKPGDGGQDPVVRIKVTNLQAFDSRGAAVEFRASTLPLGEDCEVRAGYYENVPYQKVYEAVITKVSDRDRIQTYLSVDPAPPPVDGQGNPNFTSIVDPTAAIALAFSEPMNLESVEPVENFLLTNETIDGGNVISMLAQPKPAALAIQATRLLDQAGDGTLLQLRPPMGHYHKKGQEERYFFHMLLDSRAPTDMAGNPVDVFDRTAAPVKAFSVRYTLDKDADDNLVGSRIFRFAAQDEDGSGAGSADAFGQFQLLDGELHAAPVSRFNRIADTQSLSGVTRFERGECDLISGTPPAGSIAGFPLGGIPGILYSCPSMVAVQGGPPLSFQPPAGPQIGGGLSEPHNQRGSRLQMTYREDDFGLAYRNANQYLLDIEQMHWAPFNDGNVRFDTFDRYTLRMAHSDKRPDLTFFVDRSVTPPVCVHDCFSGRSGLRTNFDSNVLAGSTYTTIVKDRVYEINPNDSFRGSTNTKFVPYPKFQSTYTWRDPRLVTWDMESDEAIGFGGAEQPAAPSQQQRDTTANISSPYVPNKPPAALTQLHVATEFTFDFGDFHGFRTKDHDPIALPLLLDFSVYPDGPANGGAANGTNLFHVALVGPCWSPISPGGYYSGTVLPGCGGIPWPETRAHTTGGIDQITDKDILINPDVEANALGSVIKDMFWGDPTKGLWQAPPKDDHVHWAQIDFVRRVSMVTYGFWDTLQPNRNNFTGTTAGDKPGLPNLVGDATGIADFVTIIDPPLSQQPVGTRIVFEFRGARSFDNENKVFNQPDDLSTTLNWTNVQLVQQRGNLLNPFYACEAYRYATPSEFVAPYQTTHNTDTWPTGARVKATGLTPYVTEDSLNAIRLPSGLLPRFLNFRIVMENNLESDPPISPRLKSFGIAYRVENE